MLVFKEPSITYNKHAIVKIKQSKPRMILETLSKVNHNSELCKILKTSLVTKRNMNDKRSLLNKIAILDSYIL